MADQMDPSLQEKLKASLWFSIGKIIDEESLRLNTNVTPQFIGAMTEMVWAQIENVATDLESFAHHAGRSTIQTDDVLLISRRNPQLQDMMQDFVDKEAVRTERAKRRKGKEVVKPRGRPKGVGKN